MAKKMRRFYKANLEAVVWNPKTNSVLAEFIGGEIITSDNEVAETLEEMGYPEVALDAESPPDYMAPRGNNPDGDVLVIPGNYDETSALNKTKAAAALKKSTEGKKSAKVTKAGSKKSKRILKRRNK